MCIFTVKWKKLAEFQAFAMQKRDNSKQDIQNGEYVELWLIIILESSAVEFLLIGTLNGRLWEELKIASPNHSNLYRCIFHW